MTIVALLFAFAMQSSFATESVAAAKCAESLAPDFTTDDVNHAVEIIKWIALLHPEQLKVMSSTADLQDFLTLFFASTAHAVTPQSNLDIPFFANRVTRFHRQHVRRRQNLIIRVLSLPYTRRPTPFTVEMERDAPDQFAGRLVAALTSLAQSVDRASYANGPVEFIEFDLREFEVSYDLAPASAARRLDLISNILAPLERPTVRQLVYAFVSTESSALLVRHHHLGKLISETDGLLLAQAHLADHFKNELHGRINDFRYRHLNLIEKAKGPQTLETNPSDPTATGDRTHAEPSPAFRISPGLRSSSPRSPMFDGSEIAEFVALARVPASTYLETWSRLHQASTLINSSLHVLRCLEPAPPDWARWRAEYQNSADPIPALGTALERGRRDEVARLGELDAIEAALRRLRAWLMNELGYLERRDLSETAVRKLPESERALLDSALMLAPELPLLIQSALHAIARRQTVVTDHLGVFSMLSILVGQRLEREITGTDTTPADEIARALDALAVPERSAP